MRCLYATVAIIPATSSHSSDNTLLSLLTVDLSPAIVFMKAMNSRAVIGNVRA